MRVLTKIEVDISVCVCGGGRGVFRSLSSCVQQNGKSSPNANTNTNKNEKPMENKISMTKRGTQN